jgi:hypothetical protein
VHSGRPVGGSSFNSTFNVFLGATRKPGGQALIYTAGEKSFVELMGLEINEL